MDSTEAGTELREGDGEPTSEQPGPPISNAQKKRDRAAAKLEKHKSKKAKSGKREEQWTGDIDRQNPAFERYYKAQGVFADENEWNEFMSSIKTDLPTTFRVTGSKVSAKDVNDIIQNVHVPNLTGLEYEGAKVDPPKAIPWYPGKLAWQFNVHKNVVRKVPQFKKMQSFLVYETEVGNICRQEAVSMLPPLVLDIEPHHKVLDMCAAPGSKTSQILEALHSSSSDASSSPPGLIIANDNDYKRAGLLVHQSSRLPSPALIVTNVDASYYPNIWLDAAGTVLNFDRILCDVPCSGDGTLRKNPIIWRQWGTASGNGLHNLQLRILQRAMKMLVPGGRIVYSTCSINPIENEAVVAAALKSANGEYHLVDISSRLPELVRKPGISEWKVSVDKEAQNLATSYSSYWESLSDSQKRDTKITESMFPPSDAASLHLERCWRIYPHLQNTGGFFVAVLEHTAPATTALQRKKPLKRSAAEAEVRGTPDPADGYPAPGHLAKKPRLESETKEVDVEMTDASEMEGDAPKVAPEEKKQPKGWVYKEDPYTYVDPDHPNVQRCLANLRIQITASNKESALPAHNLFVRNSDPTILRSVYLSNDIVKAVLTANEPSRLRIISAGLKIATKQEGSGRALAKLKQKEAAGDGAVVTSEDAEVFQKYRVLNDAVALILPYMKPEHIIHGDMGVLKVFVRRTYPLAKEFEEPYKGTFEACGEYLMTVPRDEVDRYS
ncbi:hypothetical protein M408DRAFT_330889 [Serendipita vermifera MAFF 305830]|uniref:SAM-dependent MTase RsmB/NOP-type domain-containing protein n=1 Tax=Serendipita vermifera MAFF 305830 TaxID=933852 RepID=A0A0C2WHM5_SERVB|nr:hypothetical protein M408DRAFT_330889 [Serendipita vermifera MAFF 305830]